MMGIGMAVRPPRQLTLTQRAINVLRKYGSAATLYLPGAQIPVLGPELVSNGDFSAGSAGWTASTSTVTAESGALRVQVPVVGWGGVYSSAFSTSIGNTYSVRLDILSSVGNPAILIVQTSTGTNITVLASNLPAGSFTYTFTATVSSVRIYIGNTNSATSDRLIDNISVKEIVGYTNQITGLTAGNYIDSLGTTAGAYDSPLGLALDANGVVGPELVTSPNVAGLPAGGGTRFYNLASKMASSPVANKTYQIRYQVTGYTGTGNVGLAGAAPAGVVQQNHTADGIYESIQTVTASGDLALFTSNTNTCNFVLLTIREVTGNHATQPTTASKPLLRRGLVNQLLWSGDFTNAAWMKVRVSVSGQKLIPDGTNSTHILQQTHTSAATTTYSVDAKADGYNWIALWSDSAQAGAYFNVSTGTVGTTSAGVTATIQPLDDGYFRCVVSRTVAATTWQFFVASSDNVASFAGNGTSGVLVRSTALFQGTVTAQQILAAGGIPVTTTAPASSTAGKPYWEFDGSNDFLQLNSVPFQMTDDHCIIAGAATNDFSTFRTVVGLSNSAINNSRIQLYSAMTSGSLIGMWRDDGSTINTVSFASSVIGIPYVATIRKVGSQLMGRKNGGAWTTGTATVGATTLNKADIGASSPLGFPGSFHSGAISAVILLKAAATESEIQLLEKWVGSLQGQTL